MEEKRLVEYQKAQDSAEHYNSMIWTLMALGIASSLTILHIFWTNRPEIIYSLIMLFTGAFILFYFSYLIEGAHEKKRLKYSICKKIEKENGFLGQNLETDNLLISRNKYGISIFRIMKITLFGLYFLTIITGLGSAVIEGKASSPITWGVIIVLSAIIFSLVMEGIYWKVN
ncbi:MAG: hypothetical protein WCX73_03930 [Candidatus Pacearchaeota archaeon]|jgi:uncharacterized membrane protein (DUF485 family)